MQDSGGGESEEEEEFEEEEEEEEEEFGGYHLRKRRPVIYQYQPVFQVLCRVYVTVVFSMCVCCCVSALITHH